MRTVRFARRGGDGTPATGNAPGTQRAGNPFHLNHLSKGTRDFQNLGFERLWGNLLGRENKARQFAGPLYN